MFEETIKGVTKREKYLAPEPVHNITIATIEENSYIDSGNWDKLANEIQFLISKFGLKYKVEIIKGKDTCIFLSSNRKNDKVSTAVTVMSKEINNRNWSKVAAAITSIMNHAGIQGTVGYRIKGHYIEFFI